MNRRRFIVSSISAAAIGTALATDACSSSGVGGGVGPMPPPLPGVLDLDVQYAVTNIAGYKLRTRTYNGRTVGPMVVTRPGATLRMRVVNRLPPNPAYRAPEGSVPIPLVHDVMQAMDPLYRGPTTASTHIDRMNNPHGFNDTNLHVHGLQTIPHLFAPLGTSDPGAAMIHVKPGENYLYEFPMPDDHPSGLHWYHPHKHGSTDVQVSGGMAGLIVVRGPIDEVPEIAAAREIFMVAQTLDVNPSKTHPGVYEREYKNYETKANGGYNFGTQYTMMTLNGKGIYWVQNTTPVYTPLGTPRFSVRPGEVVRLRFLNGTNYFPMMLTLPGFEAWQIGFDGVNTLEPIYIDMSGKNTPLITPQNVLNAPMRLAMSANRIELLLRAPKKPGVYTFGSIASKGIDFSDRPAINLARFVVEGDPVKMSIPTVLPKPTREYPVITERDVVARRKFVFNQGPRKDLLTGFGFTINNNLYKEMDCPTRPRVGTCEEWRLENATVEAHPFHLHENSFQLIAINDQPNNPMQVWDTFMIPPKVGGVNGSLTIRVRFVQWHGKTVFHCHILPHEDTGMMQNILMT